MEKIKSGIPGLDDLLHGGIEKKSAIMISGPLSSGKTVLCCQFLWAGLQKGEKCMYISFEEREEDIIKNAGHFGWDFQSEVDKENLLIYRKGPMKDDEVERIKDEIIAKGITRLDLDPTSLLGLFHRDLFELRKALFFLTQTLRNAGATTLFTTEVIKEHKLSRYGVEEFVSDGIIVLRTTWTEEKAFRTMQVRKMRRTSHKMDIVPYTIDDDGITVHNENMFSVK